MNTQMAVPRTTIAERVAGLRSPELDATLDARGFAQTEPVLSATECAQVADLFEEGSFRS